MEVSEDILRGIALLGDESKINAAAYKELLSVTFKDATSNLNTAIDSLGEYPNLDKLDKSILKEAYAATLVVIFEGAKINLDEAGLVSFLEDNKVDQKRAELFAKGFEAKRMEVRILLSSTSVGFPHIVDVNWRLDYFIKGRKLDKVDKLVYMLDFKTETTDGLSKDVFFTATVEELQDLVNKLKDAQKSFQTIQG